VAPLLHSLGGGSESAGGATVRGDDVPKQVSIGPAVVVVRDVGVVISALVIVRFGAGVLKVGVVVENVREPRAYHLRA
jgi:hypothetical protein